MVANRPWDGVYNVSDTIWMMAHTTQFTDRGWWYLGGGGSQLLSEGGSFVSLTSPDKRDLSIVIETVGAKKPQTLTLTLAGGFASIKTLTLWTTAEGAVFQQQAPVAVANGVVSVTVPGDNVWTLSTRVGQSKAGGTSVPTRPEQPFPNPYSDDFEGYPEDTLARYWSDLHGAYAVFTDPATGNKVLRQQAGSVAPKSTHSNSAIGYSTALGDGSLKNYDVAVMAKSEGGPNGTSAEFVIIGSHGGSASPESYYTRAMVPSSGVVLHLNMDGTWSVAAGKSGTIASGKGGAWKTGEWVSVLLQVSQSTSGPAHDALETAGNVSIAASVNGVRLFNQSVLTKQGADMAGCVWLGGGFHLASFDNFTIAPTGLLSSA
jgi:hypothetical protein